MGCLDHAFENKKITVGLLMTWMCVALIGFQSIDMFHSDFFHVGPSEKTKLMALTLNTWSRWWMVAIASFLSTCINDFTSDALIPWIQNVVQVISWYVLVFCFVEFNFIRRTTKRAISHTTSSLSTFYFSCIPCTQTSPRSSLYRS